MTASRLRSYVIGITCCLGIGAAGLAARTAEATVVRAMTLREKTEMAPVVVHGVVEHVESAWTLDDTRIRTTVVIEVLDGLKGTPRAGQRLTFSRGGGQVGEDWMTAPGLAEYEVGDEVILFLEPLGASLVSIGIGIGTYRVEVKDLGQGTEAVVTHHPKVAGLRYTGERPGRIEPLPPMTPEPLRVFKKRVRSFASGASDAPVVQPRKTPIRLAPAPQVLGRPGAAPEGAR